MCKVHVRSLPLESTENGSLTSNPDLLAHRSLISNCRPIVLPDLSLSVYMFIQGSLNLKLNCKICGLIFYVCLLYINFFSTNIRTIKK